MMADLAVDRAKNPKIGLQDRWNSHEDDEAEEEEDDGGDLNIIDRSEEPWPGQYVDLTEARRKEDSDMAWPRPT
jgi:hypothetical protein